MSSPVFRFSSFSYQYAVAIFVIMFFIYTMSKPKPLSITIKQDYRPREAVVVASKKHRIQSVHGNDTYEDIEDLVFTRFGYKIVEKQEILPKLDYIEKPTCKKVFTDWLEKSKNYDESATPPKEMDPTLRDQFLMYGFMDFVKGYMDDRSGTKSTTWTGRMIDEWTARDVSVVDNYNGEGRCMYHAFKHNGVSGQRGFVVGSLSPWVEAFALKAGAKKVTTMEYMRITVTGSDKIDYAHPVEVAKGYEKYLDIYDFGASFSSIEHSGLGRFGDVPDPIGDFREMQKIHCMLKKGGLFYLALPYGFDCLHGNLHRVYGRIRTAMMTTGFEVLNLFYLNDPNPQTMNSTFIVRGTSPEGCPHAQAVLTLKKV